MKLEKDKVLKFGFFKLARIESLKVDFRHKIGAVLVKGAKPVSIGRNHPLKCHPIIKKYSEFKTIHAEFDAIIGIDRHLAIGGTLYVYREDFYGSLSLAKPCPMCLAFLLECGIKRIYYTTADGYDEIKL